jgi:ATP-binding cassette, subfamily B, bacterial PglK
MPPLEAIILNCMESRMYMKVKDSLSLLNGKSRNLVLLFALIRVLISALDTLGVLIIGLLLAKSASSILNVGGTNSNVFLSISNELNEMSVTRLAFVALGLFIGKSFISASFTKAMADVLADSESQIASNAFKKLLNGGYKNFSDISSQELVFSLNQSANIGIAGILILAVSIISEAALLIAMSFIFMLVDLKIAIGIILYFALIGYLIYRVIGPQMQNLGARFADSALESSTSLNDSVVAFREIHTLKKQNEFIEKFSKSRSGYAKANSYAAFYGILPRYIVESALLLGAGILAVYVFRVNEASKAVGVIGIFLTGSLRMMSSLLPLQTSLNSLRALIAQSEPFFNLINKTRSIRSNELETSSQKKQKAVPVEIAFKNVSYIYPGSREKVINNVSFEIKSGEFIALIGPSGAGKTTIADLLIGLLEPSSGDIAYKNIEREEARIGYVPQSPGIISGSILENITLNVFSKDFDEVRLNKCLTNAHLSKLINLLPNGVNTDLGAQSDALSGGQMQRIGLARALYSDPGLLILDEATSALDAETESTISDTLQQLKGHCSIVVIAHRLSTVQNADRVYVIDNGQVVASGKFSELAKSNELVARYIELSQINID